MPKIDTIVVRDPRGTVKPGCRIDVMQNQTTLEIAGTSLREKGVPHAINQLDVTGHYGIQQRLVRETRGLVIGQESNKLFDNAICAHRVQIHVQDARIKVTLCCNMKPRLTEVVDLVFDGLREGVIMASHHPVAIKRHVPQIFDPCHPQYIAVIIQYTVNVSQQPRQQKSGIRRKTIVIQVAIRKSIRRHSIAPDNGFRMKTFKNALINGKTVIIDPVIQDVINNDSLSARVHRQTTRSNKQARQIILV